MSSGIEGILDTCLERVRLGGESIEQCLDSYPEHASELEPLLRAALRVMDVSSIRPRDEFGRVARSRLLSAVSTGNARGKERRFPMMRWQRGWAVALAVILAIAVVGGGTVTASSGSLPGDVLYPVKTTAEKVQSFFTFGDEANARFHMKAAERRLGEMESLAEKKRAIPESVLGRMNLETERAIEMLGRVERVKEELASQVVDLTSKQKTVLERIQQGGASLELEQMLRDALQRSERAQTELERMFPDLKKLRLTPWVDDRELELWPRRGG